jgi:hypothetical protein
MEQPPEAPTNDRPEAVLRRHAYQLNVRSRRWPLLGPTFHTFADALWWVDEAPPWSRLREAEDALRFLWHYRTGLIIGEARPYEELWSLGKRLFPRWVGFHPSRCQTVRRYAVIYRAGRMATARCLAKLERELAEPTT